MNAFGYDTLQAKIQGLSVQVGELFADLYKSEATDFERSVAMEALEAYKSLRRLLPRETEYFGDRPRHIGATAAHKATQGGYS
ncbi:MAG: hypothetical protein QF536_09710 [Arenicellales bacterium]|jgi:hypothetical protein|nr:hypothetical protein [Arenicellales bacterium]